MKERLRKMFLEMLNQQLKTDRGISTRINLYLVEVQLVKDLASVMTGCDDYYSDELHDFICSFVDTLHEKFDC